MSVATILSDSVVQHLNGLSFGKVDSINDKLALLLEAEYRRRLARLTTLFLRRSMPMIASGLCKISTLSSGLTRP